MHFLEMSLLGTPTWMWGVFITLVLGLLALDLGVLNKGSKEIRVRQSLLLSLFYMTIGVAFGGWIWFQSGQQPAMEYLTGFVIEKSLAMDNIFIIAMIFSYFAIPRQYQHRVLLWGILGVIVLRGIMIAGGAALVENFHWILYIFAAFLVFTGIRMLFAADHDENNIGDNAVLKFLRRVLPVSGSGSRTRNFSPCSLFDTGSTRRRNFRIALSPILFSSWSAANSMRIPVKTRKAAKM